MNDEQVFSADKSGVIEKYWLKKNRQEHSKKGEKRQILKNFRKNHAFC